MTPIVSVVGPANSGKTTLLGKLISELKRRGRKVAVIKHSACDIELDQKGKDSWQHAKAGADIVVVSSPNQWGMFAKVQEEWDLEALCKVLPPVDIVFTEGYRAEATPKLEIITPGEAALTSYEDLIALISDEKLETNMPRFRRNDINDLANFLEERFLNTP